MKTFNYFNNYEKLLTKDIVKYISAIYEYKGKQTLFLKAHEDEVTTLLEIAKIQSVEASNKIEGITAPDHRIEDLVKEKTTPKNRSEREISGYRDVLDTIHQNHNFIDLKPNIILQFHKQLYRLTGDSIGGNYKNADNLIAETDIDGNQFVRFKPISAFLTPQAMTDLCDEFNKALQTHRYEPLVLIPMFILDFLCVHPFNDGNGRMSRLLTLLLLYKSGFIVGKYISLERIIEKSKETYYEVLQSSSLNWHENEQDYLPFIEYSLGIIIKAYRDFEERVDYLVTKSTSKPDRIKSFIDNKIGLFTKQEVREFCSDISETTIARTLIKLVKENYIYKVGAGATTKYAKTNKK